MIEWSAQLSVGISQVDAQHQELVKAFNTLQVAMQEGKGSDTVLKTLEFLGEYAVAHFGTEERLMRRHGYPGLSEHLAAHAEFKQDFGRILAETRQTKYRVAKTMEVSRRLLDWLLGHIAQMDKKMGAWLVEQGAR